ncbi:TorF family putative porin [Derxia gummosa]|uniref:TorF family putative porin n=1 Tax=Derxia gummosa DSM 723 TaxID=1121388 RepID=A0A8B6X2P5_9BURK|nr:TorF family putative porin [Derxia gummosa]
MFRSTTLALCGASLCMTALNVRAEEEASPLTLTANVAIVSNYVFRGMSYTQDGAAVQGGFDAVHSSGLYAGVWGSNVSSKAITDASAEFDLYGGYASSVGDLAYDVGLLQFTYPQGRFAGQSYNTLEGYAGVTYSVLNLKYSRTLTNYFGFNNASMGGGDSKGSEYFEANLAYEVLPGYTAQAHAGHQKVKGYGQYNFSDYKLGVLADLGSGWQAGLAWADTTGKTALYTIGTVNTAGPKWIASLKRTF